ncbi:hypothetical protein AK972_5340 [Pseudomonas yamanorum]|nr:hypothetical protein AK972_5340 [Pseudomonas yamanorum]
MAAAYQTGISGLACLMAARSAGDALIRLSGMAALICA